MTQGRVLLADSHLSLLEGVHSLLDTLFEKVFMVADGRSLLDAVATLAPDLVVVDLSLPGNEEANIAARLNRLHPDLRVIVLSIHDDPTVVEQVMKTASAFVLKRSAATDLVPAVKEVLEGREYISPALRATRAEMSPVGRDRGAISRAGTDRR